MKSTGEPRGQCYVVRDSKALAAAQTFAEVLKACQKVFEWDRSESGHFYAPAHCPNCGTVTAKLAANPRSGRQYAECPECFADLGDA